MSDPVSISEAKTQLSKLVARAERGEEVTIRRVITGLLDTQVLLWTLAADDRVGLATRTL